MKNIDQLINNALQALGNNQPIATLAYIIRILECLADAIKQIEKGTEQNA